MRGPRALILTFVLTVLAPPYAQSGQSANPPRIGYLSLAPGPSPRSEALQQGLRYLGYVEGLNITIDYRWTDGNLDRLQGAAAELVRSKVAIIVTGGPQATRVAKEATTTIPIVMAVDYDPVGAGFAASLARPGGNITGMSGVSPELNGKRLELLKAAVPRLNRVAVLWNSAEPNAAAFLRETQAAAQVLRLEMKSLAVRAPRDLEAVFQVARKEHASALTVLTDPVTLYHRAQLTELAAKYSLPAIYSERLFTEAGGLMSYGASDRDLHRRVAVYVDKILNGAKPADLPIEQPTKYEMVLNLKVAKALGLTIPRSILVRADEVIR
jgi:putative tryptophan/tyrosine transport system substrate-binding protein